MHTVIETARRAAGISGMKKNYPDDPKQRGCGYWAAFIGSLSNDLGVMDKQGLQSARAAEEEIRKLASRVDELEQENTRLRAKLQHNGVELVRHQEGWSIEEGREVLKTIAG